ncbi:MAG: DUF1345 domain-containing protein [Acidobacteriaceae bacterium]|nr:DUF1345 domain-containing protein [Acidobacteriaceae bacterium]
MPVEQITPEPRWPAVLAVLAVAGLYITLPEYLTVGPSWIVVVSVLLLLAIILLSRRFNWVRTYQLAAHVMLAVLTLAMIGSLGLLIAALPSHKESPMELLVSAAALWGTNILVFASWYWRLDAGGPNQRDLRGSHTDGAFLFPQMTMDPDLKEAAGETDWRPGFVDYLFLAFNTSTAFSPTDVPVLSRWAKMMMMTQSLISLITIALLAARAVNIL